MTADAMARANPLRSAGDWGLGGKRDRDEARERPDECRMAAHSGDANIVRGAHFLGELCVFDIQLHEGFGVFGHECNRHDNQAFTLLPGAAYLGIGRGAYPFQRADAALVTNPPVEARVFQAGYHRLHAALDLPLIGITALDNPLWQTMRREEHAIGDVFVDVLKRIGQQIGNSRYEPLFERIAADFVLRNLELLPRRFLAPFRER